MKSLFSVISFAGFIVIIISIINAGTVEKDQFLICRHKIHFLSI